MGVERISQLYGAEGSMFQRFVFGFLDSMHSLLPKKIPPKQLQLSKTLGSALLVPEGDDMLNGTKAMREKQSFG